MTRPQMIRAGEYFPSKHIQLPYAYLADFTYFSAALDTLDLQNQTAPSAKDHSRQPSNPSPLGDGSLAPHQAKSLKSAGLDGFEHHSRSPRVSQDLSGKELQLLQEDPQADETEGTEGDHHRLILAGISGDDVNAEDGEGDDSLDDDMDDKISSSPSIDDGGYRLPRDGWGRSFLG